jgi:hypothetical protein
MNALLIDFYGLMHCLAASIANPNAHANAKPPLAISVAVNPMVAILLSAHVGLLLLVFRIQISPADGVS